jgi:ABC-2 type transport system ATP-binding protein
MDDRVIQTIDLKKKYGQVEAVNGLNLSVPRGSIYGFLGRNGSGKTTTIKMLLGMVHPTSGEARVLGKNPNQSEDGVQIRRRVGFVSEEKQLYVGMTVEQIINFTRPFFPSWNMDLEKKLLKLFELPLRQKVGKLSKGNRARLAWLLALSRSAELLILDEPSSGLDPAMTEAMLQMLVSMAASGEVTIFFSTHHIAEVEQIADHVCIIDQGRVVVEGALDDLKETYRRINLVFDKEVPSPMLAMAGLEPAQTRGRSLSLLASHNVNEIVDRARSLNAVSVDVTPVTLKEIFLDSVKPEEDRR